jgi:phenylalanyl-tRNA synthetase beta chain
MIPGTLEIVRSNISHGNKNIHLFEFGKSYFLRDHGNLANILENYVENDQLLLTFSGMILPHAWDIKPHVVDIYDVKGELETLFQKIFLDKIKFIPYSTDNALTQAGLSIEIHGEKLGLLGVVRKEILKRYDIEETVIVAELDLKTIKKHIPRERRYVASPKFPAVLRDIALVVDNAIPMGDLETCIRESVDDLISKVELFDIYVGNQIPDHKKGCAFAIEFISRDHTLTQSEIDQAMQSIMNNVSKTFHATIRK